MEIVIDGDGTARMIHHDGVDLRTLGDVTIVRGSYIEPDEHGDWWVDLSPCGGPRLGPYPPHDRGRALADEYAWIEHHLPNLNIQPREKSET